MFSKRIIESARFLRMPASSRLLYFDLGMRADDDGVVEAYTVIRATGATEDDFKILVAKNFLKILNEDLVSYITDWSENNRIRPDRKVDSIYKGLLIQVLPDVELVEKRVRADYKTSKITYRVQNVDEKAVDTEQKNLGCMDWTTSGQPTDNQRTTNGRHRIGKDRIGKSSIGEGSVEGGRTNKFVLCEADASRIIHSWNDLGVSSVKSISNNRLALVKARIAEHGLDVFLEAIKSINESPFLLGRNEKGWVITFDWFIKPSNFTKVLEGNYKPRLTQSQQTKKTASSNFTERKNDIDAEALQKVAKQFGVNKDDE
jgi:hypothetical protein